MKRAILIVVTSGLVVSVAAAQNRKTNTPVGRRSAVEYGTIGSDSDPRRKTDPRHMQNLVESWKDTKDAGEREKIEKSLRDSLQMEFEARMTAHEREIKELEEKVRQLRERLVLRKEKQAEIVEHRMQQILRDAQGLGWGTDTTKSYGASYFVVDPVTPYVVPAPVGLAPPTSTTTGFRPTPILQTAPEQPVDTPPPGPAFESSSNEPR